MKAQFSLPPSRSPSPSSTPPPPYQATSVKPSGLRTEFALLDEDDDDEDGPDVYDAMLAPWRAGMRRALVKVVARETEVIARMQNHIRTPFWDAYFVYTSSLGTHSFFMTVLPALFFFGCEEMGRGLLLVLVPGVYLSSFIKDLFCSPRPFAPPVTRLTIGTHHLEYGFPSTHSTSSVSLALFFFSHIHRLSTLPSTHGGGEPLFDSKTYYLSIALLSFYTFSIVFGRLYTAMHSFTDCIAGMILGGSIWFAFDNWLGLGLHNVFERWVMTGTWKVPVMMIAVCLLAVHKHPQPVDDCPCFEDSIAFNSVLMGCLVARFATLHYPSSLPILHPAEHRSPMPFSSWSTYNETVLWFSTASLKMTLGILIIFAWRLIAKTLLHLILPPVFRWLSTIVVLPARRFYVPATDYKNMPRSEGGGLGGLRAVPSVIDLPSGQGMEIEFDTDTDSSVVEEVSGVRSASGTTRELKMRGASAGMVNEDKVGMGEEALREERGKAMVKKHYDADVLTKVFVYCGIGVLACEALPTLFDAVGWGVRGW